MKNAKEMFKKLGYAKFDLNIYDKEKEERLNVFYEYRNLLKDIHFYETGIYFVDWEHKSCIFAKKEEVLAIVQQCRELGWLE